MKNQHIPYSSAINDMIFDIKKKGVVSFVDSYHLLDIIRSNKNLDQYIVAIEKEKKHD